MGDWFEEYEKRHLNQYLNQNKQKWHEYIKHVRKLTTKKVSLNNNIYESNHLREHKNNSKANYWQRIEEHVEQIIDNPSDKFHNIQELSKKQKKKIGSNHATIEATLDLHGESLASAETKLIRFVLDCYFQNKVNLLIITGKGTSYSPAKLKEYLPKIANNMQLAKYISKLSLAKQEHGGEGAFYIKLKK